MNSIKLQAAIAHAGIASRRKAEKLIEAGEVKVNGILAHIGQRVDTSKDKITVSGENIQTAQEDLLYFLVYKPAGVVSTAEDELSRKNVLNLLPSHSGRLYPVGRLDIESEGLMLITNDGELTHKLTHPSFEFSKTYQVTVAGKISNLALDHLRRGVKLREGYTTAAQVELIERDTKESTFEITIHEGRNRQVRRMCERVGYDVIQLVRIKLGPFTLDDLGEKNVVELSKQEVAEKFSSSP